MLRGDFDRNGEDNKKKREESDVVGIHGASVCVNCTICSTEFTLGDGVPGPITVGCQKRKKKNPKKTYTALK